MNAWLLPAPQQGSDGNPRSHPPPLAATSPHASRAPTAAGRHLGALSPRLPHLALQLGGLLEHREPLGQVVGLNVGAGLVEDRDRGSHADRLRFGVEERAERPRRGRCRIG
jgi:hypothetical protein